MIKRTALIDLDPLIHIVANVQWYAGNQDNSEKVKIHVNQFLDTILKNCDSSSYIMFYQDVGHLNYRKDILPEYKGHRKANEAIDKWKPLICEVLEKRGAYGLWYIESDDALMLVSEKYQKDNVNYLIVENDKDLAMIPGAHYNPYKTKMDNRWFNYTSKQASLSFWSQVISGDPTDMPNSICGVQQVGPAKAVKALGGVKTPLELYKFKAMQAYTDKYGIPIGLRRMAITYDMVYLLREPVEHIPESAEVLEITPTPYVDTMEGLFENNSSDNTESII